MNRPFLGLVLAALTPPAAAQDPDLLETYELVSLELPPEPGATFAVELPWSQARLVFFRTFVPRRTVVDIQPWFRAGIVLNIVE